MTDRIDTESNHAVTNAGPRRLSIAAGLATLVVGAIHFLTSGGALEQIDAGLLDNINRPLLQAIWHGYTATMFLFGVALIVTAWGPRAAARTVGLLAAIHFGYCTIILGSASASVLGSPFALLPVFLLGLLSILALGAALRAR